MFAAARSVVASEFARFHETLSRPDLPKLSLHEVFSVAAEDMLQGQRLLAEVRLVAAAKGGEGWLQLDVAVEINGSVVTAARVINEVTVMELPSASAHCPSVGLSTPRAPKAKIYNECQKTI